VEAFEFSLPAATEVERLKLASDELARPEPPSKAVQASDTFELCQRPSAEAHEAEGGFRSILLPLIGPAVAQFPARSHT
jgi:hypothetical protein